MSCQFAAKPYFKPVHFGPGSVELVLHYCDLTAIYIKYITDKNALAPTLPHSFEPTDLSHKALW